MQKISTLFGNRATPAKRTRTTERGEILDIILGRLNPARKSAEYKPLTHGQLAYILEGIPTKDLYYLISVCNDAERRGFPWSAIFWKEIKAPKTTKP